MNISTVLSSVGELFSGKYYVTQQLVQMQAHRINKDQLIARATGKTKEILETIFEEYDKEIEADEWSWVKRNNKLYCLKMEGGFFINDGFFYTVCPEMRHDGRFPPFAAIADTMKECRIKELDKADAEKIFNDTNFETMYRDLKKWVTAYVSNLEFWVLQLEALEQDMAIVNMKL